MDLERFPTSPSALKMLGMVTHGFYDESYVGKWLYQVMGAELDAAGSKAEGLPLQAFLDRATWGLCYWETLVGLPVRDDLGYAERRALVQAMLDKRHPCNPAWIRQFLEAATGRTVTVTENPGTYTFSIRIGAGGAAFSLPSVLGRLDMVKPAHLGYEVLLVVREEIPLLTGTAIHLIDRKYPVSQVDDPMLKLEYLDVQHVRISPHPGDTVQFLPGSGRVYLLDDTGYSFLSDENGALLYEDE
jgi:hypothetical protein